MAEDARESPEMDKAPSVTLSPLKKRSLALRLRDERTLSQPNLPSIDFGQEAASLSDDNQVDDKRAEEAPVHSQPELRRVQTQNDASALPSLNPPRIALRRQKSYTEGVTGATGSTESSDIETSPVIGLSSSSPFSVDVKKANDEDEDPFPASSPRTPAPTTPTSPRPRIGSRSMTDTVSLDAFPLSQLRQWMHCFCVVNFDLELGQDIEMVYPATSLLPEELQNIAFSSFPDNNAFDVGDTIYSFRTRYNESVASSDGYLHGYVFFRQKRDTSIRRGYFQKSLVIISQHAHVGLFSQMLQLLGPTYFDVGKPILEAASHNVASWEPPVLGRCYDLPFVGSTLEVELSQNEKPQLLETSPFSLSTFGTDGNLQILASIPPKNALLAHFRDVLPDLWACWELMILAEPLVVVGTTPQVSSEAVRSLIDLIKPIQYCGDYRPFFTVQDTDFKFLISTSKTPSKVVLGVTNPFFSRALEHWPHMLRLGKPRTKGPMSAHRKPAQRDSQFMGVKADYVTGLTSKRKTVVQKDKKLLKILAEAAVKGQPPDFVINNILRRHFVELTERFLTPLNRYFSTLIPSNLTLSTSATPPRLKPFHNDDFLKSLQTHGAPLSVFKGSGRSTSSSQIAAATAFYREFLQCGNFATWLAGRTDDAQAELQSKYLGVLCEGNVRSWVHGKHEVEVVDLLVRIQDLLKKGENMNGASAVNGQQPVPSPSTRSTSTDHGLKASNSGPTPRQREMLQKQAEKLVAALPADLRTSLQMGP